MIKDISEKRSKIYEGQVKKSIFFRVGAILISFLLVPIMIKYLGEAKYGIWSTMLSIISWIAIFDLGVGNGLKNKIAESLAKENRLDAQKYISSSYVFISCIALILFLVCATLSSLVSWQSIFNTKDLSEAVLKTTINISFFFVCINFILGLLLQIASGLQKHSISVFNQFLSNFLSLIFIYILFIKFDSSIILMAIFYGLSLVLSNLFISLWFYRLNKDLKPRFRLCEMSYIKPLFSLGMRFFIIQIAVIVLFTTDRILITQLIGPISVTEYDVVFKLMSIITICHGIFMAPLWASYSDAHHRGDFIWMRRMVIKQLRLFMVFFFCALFLMFLSPQIIKLWISPDFLVDSDLIFSMGIFVLVLSWNNIFAMVVNGTGKLNIQLFTAIIGIIINIPLSILMVRAFGFESDGIVIGTIISLLLFSILGPLQVFKMLSVISKA